MICQYSHHPKHGQELGSCPTHPNEPLKCATFACGVCLLCNPSDGKPCLICGVPRFQCVC
jgi:hypothetical protein